MQCESSYQALNRWKAQREEKSQAFWNASGSWWYLLALCDERGEGDQVECTSLGTRGHQFQRCGVESKIYSFSITRQLYSTTPSIFQNILPYSCHSTLAPKLQDQFDLHNLREDRRIAESVMGRDLGQRHQKDLPERVQVLLRVQKAIHERIQHQDRFFATFHEADAKDRIWQMVLIIPIFIKCHNVLLNYYCLFIFYFQTLQSSVCRILAGSAVIFWHYSLSKRTKSHFADGCKGLWYCCAQ